MYLQVLVEADVPGDSLITYVAIPRYLYWKFRKKGRRYYAKFNDEVHVLCICIIMSCFVLVCVHLYMCLCIFLLILAKLTFCIENACKF